MKGVFLIVIWASIFFLITNVNAQVDAQIVVIDDIDSRTKNILNIVKTLYSDIVIYGTEYTLNDAVTIFLQLKDTQGFPVNNGDCLIDIYSPNQPNLTHPNIILNAPMLYLNNSDGLYYYDMSLPNITGVYMLSATCSYPFDLNWVYPDNTKGSNFTQIQGTYLGDTLSLNSKDDFLYMKCSSTLAGTKVCEAYYDFNCSCIVNATSIELFYAGESSSTPTMIFYVYNWTGSNWIQLPNSITFSGGASSTAPIGINDFQSNIIPENDTIDANGTMRIRLMTSSGSVFTLFDNWLNIRFSTTTGGVEDLKGSGELHYSLLQQNMEDFILAMQDAIDPIETVCENDTLVTRTSRIIKINNREITIPEDETRINCTYGCVNNSCVLPPYLIYGIIVVIIIVVIIIYYYLSKQADERAY